MPASKTKTRKSSSSRSATSRARGGLEKLAESVSLNPEHVVRMLSEVGNTELRTLETLLDVLGFRLSITLKEAS